MRSPTDEELEILAPAIAAFGMPSLSRPYNIWIADFTIYDYASVWICMDNPNFARCQINQKYGNLMFNGTVKEVVSFITSYLKEKEEDIKSEIKRLSRILEGVGNGN